MRSGTPVIDRPTNVPRTPAIPAAEVAYRAAGKKLHSEMLEHRDRLDHSQLIAYMTVLTHAHTHSPEKRQDSGEGREGHAPTREI